MNRRTLLQGVLAFVGLSRFVQAKPDRIANQHSNAKSHMDAMAEAMESDIWGQPPTWQAYQDAEVEIREMCYTFLKGIRDADLYWHVNASRSAFQHNCANVSIDYGIRGGRVKVDFMRFGIDLLTWVNYSHAEKQTFVNRQIGDLLVELTVAGKIKMSGSGKDIYFVNVDHLRSMA